MTLNGFKGPEVAILFSLIIVLFSGWCVISGIICLCKWIF